jgi:predicted HTH transcriptional regulator
MRMDNLLEKRWSRNASLVQGLVALDVMEELGYGLDRMVAAMAAAGLPRPVFADKGGTFVVTLYGHGSRLLGGVELSPPRQEPAATRLAVPMAARSPEERQAWVLEYLRTVGPLAPQAYAAALGISIDTAKRDLRALVAEGRVRAEGMTRDRRYLLAE